MTLQEAVTVLGPDADFDVFNNELDSCVQYSPERAPDGVTVMAWNGVVSSIWIENPDIHTAENLGVGSTAAQVRDEYRDRVVKRAHEYIPNPAEYLDVWTTPPSEEASAEDYQRARGISFHVGEDGKVYTIAGGDASIKSVEGCA